MAAVRSLRWGKVDTGYTSTGASESGCPFFLLYYDLRGAAGLSFSFGFCFWETGGTRVAFMHCGGRTWIYQSEAAEKSPANAGGRTRVFVNTFLVLEHQHGIC